MCESGSRKYALTPLQNRIFWVLEEAGSETFYQLLIEVSQSTLYPGVPLTPSNWAPFELARAVEGLERIGFVVMVGGEARSEERLLKKAAVSVCWIEGKLRWMTIPGEECASELEIVLTENAYEAYRHAR